MKAQKEEQTQLYFILYIKGSKSSSYSTSLFNYHGFLILRFIEYLHLKGTPKDQQVQLPAPHSTAYN